MPNTHTGKVPFFLLPKTDSRYLKWKRSLKKRPPPWNKGKTKKTDKRVRKTSETFKKKKIDNFRKWRENMRYTGKFITSESKLKRDQELATLIGLILGDGNIHSFPRTEKLTITLGTDKPELITYTLSLVDTVFNKKCQVLHHSTGNAVRITLYQKYISSRLQIPCGNRSRSNTGIPKWIWNSDKHLISCLRGLFEAEGSLSIHAPTYTYNFSFSNKNPRLLSDVRNALTRLNFHPEVRPYAIRLRKKSEVQYFRRLINFRVY